MFVVCEEHLDQAMDDFVEEYGASPDVHRLDEVKFTAWTAPETCQFCSARPRFLVI